MKSYNLFVLVVNAVFYGLPFSETYAQEQDYLFGQLLARSTSPENSGATMFSQYRQETPVGYRTTPVRWLTFSANLDASYRKTQFYDYEDHAKVFTGDGRLDLWLPPFRDEFSWGPYFCLQGVASNKDYEWENNWGARPGVGFQVYPFSSSEIREESPKLAELFGPLHLFVEHNKVHYSRRENAWRPDEQVRFGVDYWREANVQDINKAWWGETWNGLVWYSTCGFDKDYDTLMLANTLRVGIRKPGDEILSMFTPYLAAESSLSENGTYFWENRLLFGGGIRFTPPLKFFSPGLNITRFVVYAEYLDAVVHYRASADPARPDYDFRVGINVYIGEWWPSWLEKSYE